MRPFFAVLGAAGLLIGASGMRSLAAQPAQTGWNDPRTRQLVELATARRAQQLADTGLVDYQATATGYLTFLAQVGEGFTEPPRIVKADQLALEVYWKAPNLSKQRIVGRRDTLLLPTDIRYHRDHLGIVQNNFPETIRLGDGDEVRDVPHPLSARGMAEYDFAIADSLRITIPGRAIDVYQVRVRPRNDRLARIVGALFLDRETGQVVRMAFSFTRAAFLDKNLEDLSIVLENRLVGTRFWLPNRQEIEIRRTGQWFDYPARGIIRGRWEIADYRINQGFAAAQFTGPEIVQAPPAEQRRYPWTGRVLDSLPPDVRVTTDEDVRRVQDEARALVRAEALQRGRSAAVAARGVSDFVRYDRVEGLSVGGGYRQRLGAGLSATVRGRWGFEDREPKGELGFGWQNAAGRGIRLRLLADHESAGDEPERSTTINGLAAQEFGSDYTDPYFRAFIGTTVDLSRIAGIWWSVDGGFEAFDQRRVNATPARGRFLSTLAVKDDGGFGAQLRASVPTRLWLFGTELSAEARLRGWATQEDCNALPGAECGPSEVTRGSLRVDLERPIGRHRLVTRTSAAAVRGSRIPPQFLAYYGGPMSGPGYDYHSLVGTAGVSQRLEWRLPVPFIAIPLGRFGRAPASATLAPYAHVVGVRAIDANVRLAPDAPDGPGVLVSGGGTWRGHPSVGVGILTLFDLVRFDVARGLRDGRWTFNVDVSREFWRVL
ncbi:MAG TPA: hypothetical protein VEA99_02395 [Gemmatimonadaceae bacterium]|nr:hypothetical protein [Gemmatimonadaceae bacterium]